MEKETPEEAAERIFTSSFICYKIRRQSFIDGAKWQAAVKRRKEKTYTEKEVLIICKAYDAFINSHRPNPRQKEQWFHKYIKNIL